MEPTLMARPAGHRGRNQLRARGIGPVGPHPDASGDRVARCHTTNVFGPSSSFVALPPIRPGTIRGALITVLRYLMAELSQTLDVADALARTAQHSTVQVTLDEEDDVNLMMQAYVRTDGKSTEEQRWVRALTRLHKELLGQALHQQVLHARLLRQGLLQFQTRSEGSARAEQLNALLVVLMAENPTHCVDGGLDPSWLHQWETEIGAFLPGYTPVLIESQPTAPEDPNVEQERTLEDREQDRCARADDVAEWRLRNHEAMCAREIDELKEDAKAYQAWEREQMRRALLRTDEGAPPKRRCVLTLEAASGSMDKPRIEHTMAFDVPMGGEPPRSRA
eukprot:s2873_g4.t1